MAVELSFRPDLVEFAFCLFWHVPKLSVGSDDSFRLPARQAKCDSPNG